MAKSIPACIVDQPHLTAQIGQAHVCVVFSELQTELGATGEHAIGLGHALGGEVVNQYAQVGGVSSRRPSTAHVVGQAFSLAALKRCVDSCKQALGGGLFVSGGAVNLPRKKQPADRARLKTALEFARVEVVIFDGIAWANNVSVLQALHRSH